MWLFRFDQRPLSELVAELRSLQDDVRPFPYEDVVRVYSERPAQIYGLWPRKGRIAVGADADVVVIATPWDGATQTAVSVANHLQGKVVISIPRGEVVLKRLRLPRAQDGELAGMVQLQMAKQLTVRGAMGATTVGYQWAARQIETDPRIDDLVSHQFPLSEASRALQAAAGLLGREELISVAVTF